MDGQENLKSKPQPCFSKSIRLLRCYVDNAPGQSHKPNASRMKKAAARFLTGSPDRCVISSDRTVLVLDSPLL